MSTSPNYPDALGGYRSIAYADASSDQQARVLDLVQQLFGACLPLLTTTQWQEALDRCYPVLEIENSTIDLREEDLTRLATYLQYEQVPLLPYRPYCGESLHVADKLLGFCRLATETLRQTSTLPPSNHREALAQCHAALESMVGSDAVAKRIKQAFAFKRPLGVRVYRAYPQESLSAPELSIQADMPAPHKTRAIEELPDHWQHLQQWFRKNNQPARPWNVSAIASELQLSHSVARALLTAPKGAPGMARTAFSHARLRQLQRYFRAYGYEKPA